MSTAKEKDRILAQIMAFTPHSEIVGLEKYIDEFVKDGYVTVIPDTRGGIIKMNITPQGKRFIENGGYTTRRKGMKRRRLSRKMENALYFLLGAATTAIVERLVGLLFE